MARRKDNLSEVLGISGPAGLDIKTLAKILQSYGRDGDTMLVHITPEEVEYLKKMGGRGTLNPETGVYEFAPVNLTSQGGFFNQPRVDYNSAPTSSSQTGGGPSGESGSPYTLASGGFFGGEKAPPAPYGEQGQNPGWGHEGQPLVVENTPVPMNSQPTPSTAGPSLVTGTSTTPTPTSASTKSNSISNAYISPTTYRQVQNPDFQQIVLNLLRQQAARYR